MRPLILLLSLLNSNLPQILCDGSFCDAEKCVNTQPLEAWFEFIKDPKSVLKSDIEENVKIDAQPLVSIVPCDTKDALWNYKYAGSKGKRKIFTGKGKITFVKVKGVVHQIVSPMSNSESTIFFKEYSLKLNCLEFCFIELLHNTAN